MRHLFKTTIALCVISLFSHSAYSQDNLDLISGKEYAEMSRLNPAFTSVLNELRLLTAKSGELNLGLEGKLFKTPNHFGFYFQQNDIDHLRRQKIDLQIARDKQFEKGLQLKYAVQLQYANKKFNRSANEIFPISFNDYHGQSYLVDSSNLSSVILDKEILDIGLGFGGTYKNLVFGANVRHLNRPNVALFEGQTDQLPMELSAQVGGFLTLGTTQLFPHLIYAQQDDDMFLSGGLGITRNNITFMGEYEQIQDQVQFDFGLNFRYDRFMFAVNYVYPQIDNYEFSLSDVRFTLNANIRKPKIADDSILKKLRSLY